MNGIRAAAIVSLTLLAACNRNSSPGTTPAPATTIPAATATKAAAAPSPASSPAGRPLYYEREITPADLDGRTLRELDLMRNWIYARAGNPFRKQWLHEYFSAQPWYKPGQLDLARLSEIDRKNAETIARASTELSTEELTRRREALLAEHRWSGVPERSISVFSTDGKLLADGAFSPDIWEVATGNRLVEFPSEVIVDQVTDDFAEESNVILALGFSADSARLASVTDQGSIRVRNVRDGKLVQSIEAKTGTIDPDVAFADGPWRMWLVLPKGPRAWNLETGEEIVPAPAAPAPAPQPLVVTHAWSDVKDVAAVDAYRPGEQARLWRWTDPVRLFRTSADQAIVSPDGTRVLVTGAGLFAVLDGATGKPLPGWRGHWAYSEDEKVEMALLSRALGVASPVTLMADRTPLDDPKLLDELLTVEMLKDYSRRDLRLTRNLIYARHGRPFQSPLLREYFERMEWYRADPSFTDARLTAIDKKNIKIISSVEATVGGPMNDTEQYEQLTMEGA